MNEHPKSPKGQVVGYVRVSSADQNEARQLEALGEVDVLFQEKVSGKNTKDRTELQRLMQHIRAGDLVRVKSPDRLARSTEDLLSLIRQIKEKGAEIEFLDNPTLNTDTPQGEFMITILAGVAQMERKIIRERQAEGIALAKKRGVYERRRKLSPEVIGHARERISSGVPKAVVARELGVSRATLYDALNGRGTYKK